MLIQETINFLASKRYLFDGKVKDPNYTEFGMLSTKNKIILANIILDSFQGAIGGIIAGEMKNRLYPPSSTIKGLEEIGNLFLGALAGYYLGATVGYFHGSKIASQE